MSSQVKSETKKEGSVTKMPSRKKDLKDLKDLKDRKDRKEEDNESVPKPLKETEEIKLTERQEYAFKLLKEGKSIFLTGPAGGGKSYLINLFKKYYSDSLNIAVTATTGIAAISIGGTTIHSCLGLGLGNVTVKQLHEKVMKTPYLKKRWKTIDVLIIDEISMLSPDLFDTIEAVARAVRLGAPRLLVSTNDVSGESGESKEDKKSLIKNQVNGQPAFGGIQIIATGDFAQLPPVKCDKFCFEASTWDSVIQETVFLDQIVRQRNPEFQDVLNSIRKGEITKKVKELLKSRENVELKNEFGIKPTKIFMTNAEIDFNNEKELDLLAEKGNEFHEFVWSVEFFSSERVKDYAKDLEKIRKSCLATDRLQICEEAQVMLLKNIDLEAGLANGSRGVIVGFEAGYPVVRFLNGEERTIYHDSWDFYENERKWATVTQLPLKVAWCISSHKCQGMTLDFAEVDLSSVFEYGQAYVALSRVKNPEGLCIRNLNFSKIKAHPKYLEFCKKYS